MYPLFLKHAFLGTLSIFLIDGLWSSNVHHTHFLVHILNFGSLNVLGSSGYGSPVGLFSMHLTRLFVSYEDHGVYCSYFVLFENNDSAIL